MNVRLVAYRNSTQTATVESSYELDLQEEPNISLNFQFADIKEPEKRKASYSQTFKLPFTDNNNEFFQNWYNVNLETLVYSTKKKFNAVLYVGTVPQFEGFIQLKSVFLKKGLYEVVLMSTSADLFTNIGTKKLQDCIGDELDHVYSDFNIKASWDGSTDGFFNVDSSPVSLRDDTVNVQKVMYPFSFTRPKSFYDGTNNYLGMSDVSANEDAAEKKVDITQFRPAIQIKELVKKIIAQAGFSFTSTFINGSYFGKLYMTTGGHTGMPMPVERESVFQLDGQMMVGNDTQWGTYTITQNIVQTDPDWTVIQANTDTPITGFTMPLDPGNAWDTTNMTLTKVSANLNQVKIKFIVETTNLWAANLSIGEGYLDPNQDYPFELEVRRVGDDALINFLVVYGELPPNYAFAGTRYRQVEFTSDLNSLNVGESCYFKVRPRYFRKFTTGGGSPDGVLILGSSQCFLTESSNTCNVPQNYLFNGAFNEISAQWTGYGTNIYDKIVDVDQNIDPELTQKDFLKDIIQRFNLVIVADNEDSTKLKIEPYNDFAASGKLLHWSDKLDTDKEIVIKDTSSLQKQQIIYKDQTDVDLLNKSIAEEQPQYNPYGIYRQQTTFNEFASGKLENTPVFAPYINEKVFTSTETDEESILTNVATQYEWTYKETDTGTEDVLEPTKHKLFFYNGSPTDIKSFQLDTSIYLHKTDAGSGQITAIEFTNYPLCTPFDLTPNSDGISSVLASTRSLYFNQNGPICGQLQVFNWNAQSNAPANGLFNKYWYPYLNDIYGQEARILECHMNLNETDIFEFSFADEIFIKDTYYRILSISNYQVGQDASSKVTLLKVNEKYNGACFECDSVLADFNGNNTLGIFYVFAPISNPTQAFTFPDSVYVSPECCECVGGTTRYNFTFLASQNLYPCEANSNSLSVRQLNAKSNRAIYSGGTSKAIYSGKIFGLNQPMLFGTNTDKYAQRIVPTQGDDLVIKYKNYSIKQPKIDGESHRMILIGNTTGNTKGYAYTQGDSSKRQIQIPINGNMFIRVKGTATVIGGTSTNYTLGTLEGFAYYTAFISKSGTITQLGTAGGTPEFSLKEGVNPQTCTLSILSDGKTIEFGLQDSQTDTQRVWQLTVDFEINNIYNIERSFSESYALFQNFDLIQLQNGEYLLWN